MNVLTNSLRFAVIASLVFGSALTRTKEDILASVITNREAKPFLFFESYGKFPHAVINYPMKNEVQDILFACDTNGVDFVSSPGDFANLIPAKFRKSCPLCSTYQEHKYQGFFADKLILGTVCTNSYTEQFKEPFMVPEYRSGMAMKWVFATAEQFRGFKEYFMKNITAPASTKPLLVLEIEKNPEALTDEDLIFLDQFFDVADLTDFAVDQKVDEYVKNLVQAQKDASDYAKNQVGKSFNYMTVDMLDKEFESFDTKKLAVRAAKYALLGFTILLIAKIADERLVNPVKTNIIDKLLDAIWIVPAKDTGK